MPDVIATRYPVARKSYRCDACEWLRGALGAVDFTFAELRLIVQARRNGWMIQPGQMYVLCIQKVDGDFCVFRAIPAIDDLCHKYDLYQEW